MRYIYNISKENTVCIYVWTCASHSKIYYDMRVFPVYCFLRHLVGLECHILTNYKYCLCYISTSCCAVSRRDRCLFIRHVAQSLINDKSWDLKTISYIWNISWIINSKHTQSILQLCTRDSLGLSYVFRTIWTILWKLRCLTH